MEPGWLSRRGLPLPLLSSQQESCCEYKTENPTVGSLRTSRPLHFHRLPNKTVLDERQGGNTSHVWFQVLVFGFRVPSNSSQPSVLQACLSEAPVGSKEVIWRWAKPRGGALVHRKQSDLPEPGSGVSEASGCLSCRPCELHGPFPIRTLRK